jgi:hypothetical protein
MNKVVKRVVCPGAEIDEVSEFCRRILGSRTNGWGTSVEFFQETHGQSGRLGSLNPVVLLYDSFPGSVEQAELMIKLRWS